jgi:hypothetical protein
MLGSGKATGLDATVIGGDAYGLLISADDAAGMVDGDVVGIISQKGDLS